jgi:hypothetical protein
LELGGQPLKNKKKLARKKIFFARPWPGLKPAYPLLGLYQKTDIGIGQCVILEIDDFFNLGKPTGSPGQP